MNRSKVLGPIGVIGACALLIAACSSGSTAKTHTNVGNTQTTTASATKDLTTLNWYGDYRPVYSLDPIKTADYPEETILPNVCTSLLQRSSDYRLLPSLASAWKQTSPTALQFTIRSGVKFSDASPMTPGDVVYSLKRNMNPQDASSFADSFTLVKSIAQTGPNQVTVTFSKPNTVFVETMATLAGSVVSEKYAQAKGKSFGTPQGGVMCAGPYQVASYDGTHDLTLTRNPYYWDTAHPARTATVHFVFPADPNALSNAIAGGQIEGGFDLPPTILGPLSKSNKGKLYLGGTGSTPENVDIIPTNVNSGPLAKPAVRQALSLAIDRSGLAKAAYSGAAQPLYAVAGPGLFGQMRSAYQPTYDSLVTKPDLAKAKQMVSSAGATGETIRFEYPSDQDYVVTIATYLQQVAKQIGLNIKLVGKPSAQFGNLFIDASARKGVDAFITINYLESPSPLGMLQSFATPSGYQDYEGYNNPRVTSLLDQGNGATPARQAQLVNQVQRILAKDVPWIPLLAPDMTLLMAKGVTGAPLTFSFMSSPWLAQVGGV